MAQTPSHCARPWRILAYFGVLVSCTGMFWFLTTEGASERTAVVLVAGGLIAALGAWTSGEFLALPRREEHAADEDSESRSSSTS